MPQRLGDIKALLAERGLRPKKSLGQNFLIEPTHIDRLIDRSGAAEGDLVLEVGPGTGAMTEALLERGCTVIACELDRHLAALIRDRLADRVNLIEGDCLHDKRTVHPTIDDALAGRPFRLVANLPYGAASPLMVALAQRSQQCLGQYVTIQREVAQRLRAEPNTRDYSELTVIVGAMCRVERVATLPPGCFWPSPKVSSEMIAIEPRRTPPVEGPEHAQRLGMLCRTLFTQRRKQIGAILGRDHPALDGVDASRRPESFTFEELAALAQRTPTG